MKHTILMMLMVLALVVSACTPQPAIGRQDPPDTVGNERPMNPGTGIDESLLTFVSTDPQECSLIRFTCADGKVPFSDERGCGCAPSAPSVPSEGTSSPIDAVFCEEPRPEACTREYMPVCGFKSNGDFFTAGNKCEACANSAVDYYVPGACDALDNQAQETLLQYVSTDPEECALILYYCAEGMVGFSDESGCGCKPDPELFKKVPVYCEEPRPEICTLEYMPVCGFSSDGTQVTAGNKCGACADPSVEYYVVGVCDADLAAR